MLNLRNLFSSKNCFLLQKQLTPTFFRFISNERQSEGAPSLNLEFEEILKLGFKQKWLESEDKLSESNILQTIEVLSSPDFKTKGQNITSDEIRGALAYLSISKLKNNFSQQESIIRKVVPSALELHNKFMKEAGEPLDIHIYKSATYFARMKLANAKQVLGYYHEICTDENIVKNLSLEDTCFILLLLHDLVRFSALKKAVNGDKEKLNGILNRLKPVIDSGIVEFGTMEQTNLFYLAKILFCYLRLGYRDSEFLTKILRALVRSDLMRFDEMEITSLFYTMITMEKKLKFYSDHHQNKMYAYYIELYNRLESVITSKLGSHNLSYTRVPYILYCFSMVGRANPKLLQNLMEVVITNIKKYTITEVCTVLYCLYKMPDLDPNFDKLILILTFYFDQTNLSLAMDTNLFMIFLGVRKAFKECRNPKHKSYLDMFIHKAMNQLENKFELMQFDSKIRLIYEVSHTHKFLTKEDFILKYQTFFLELDLSKLNTHDLITIGYIMKKYLVIDQASLDFWKKYFLCLNRISLDNSIECNRTKLIFQNLRDMIKGIVKLDNSVKNEWLDLINSEWKNFEKGKDDTTKSVEQASA